MNDVTSSMYCASWFPASICMAIRTTCDVISTCGKSSSQYGYAKAPENPVRMAGRWDWFQVLPYAKSTFHHLSHSHLVAEFDASAVDKGEILHLVGFILQFRCYFTRQSHAAFSICMKYRLFYDNQLLFIFYSAVLLKTILNEGIASPFENLHTTLGWRY